MFAAPVQWTTLGPWSSYIALWSSHGHFTTHFTKEAQNISLITRKLHPNLSEIRVISIFKLYK